MSQGRARRGETSPGPARRGVSPSELYVNKWPRKTTSEAEAQGQGSSSSSGSRSYGIQASKRGLRMVSAAPDKAQWRRCDAEEDAGYNATCSTAVAAAAAACSHRGSLYAFYFLFLLLFFILYLPSSSFSFWPHSFILGVCVCVGR